jgi:hypothetical protein
MKKQIISILIIAVAMCSYITRSIDPSCIELPNSLYNYANISFPADVLNNISEMDNMPGNNYIISGRLSEQYLGNG